MPAISRRDLRLASGLVLFTYLMLHLACHAFGLVSLDAAETALRATVAIWHSAVGTTLLYGAAAVHVGLALLAIYDRRTLRMAPEQALRIVLGLTMPIVLIGHFVATRYAFEHFGLPAQYQRVVASLWATDGQGRQLALLAPGWLHGCLGLKFAFGSRRLWQRMRFVLFGSALLLPVLAGLGFLAMGRELAEHGDVAAIFHASMTASRGQALGAMRDAVLAGYASLIGLIAIARIGRSVSERRRNAVIRIAYPGRNAVVPRGWTVLEASRSHGIAHRATCGGRARCTTCRVRVMRGEANCPPPDIDEHRALERINADGSIRLACQLRPTGDVSVRPLLAVEHTWWRAPPPPRPTTERELAVLGVGVRFGSARGVETGSAHDTIYALDRFNAVVGTAIDSTGGLPCRRTGESWMALFGLDASTIREACLDALVAATRIEERMIVLAERLSRELGLAADFSINVHVGPVVAGMVGEGEARSLSAVGDAIRASERLQAYALRHRARFVISKAAVAGAGILDSALEWHAGDNDVDGVAAPALCSDSSARALAAQCQRS